MLMMQLMLIMLLMLLVAHHEEPEGNESVSAKVCQEAPAASCELLLISE